jgi:hypothetical protein
LFPLLAVRDPKGPELRKGSLGPLSKSRSKGRDYSHGYIFAKITKLVDSFDNRMFKSEGDALLGDNKRNAHLPKPRNLIQRCEGTIPMREGDTFRDSVRICHRFGSSRLNLACERLLLGMGSYAHKGIPCRALPPASDLH